MIDLGGKTVLVTGASRGIGWACAETLGRAGAHVVLHYAGNRAAAASLAKTLPAGRAYPVEADLAAPSDVAFLTSGLAPHATGTTVDVNGASYVR